MPFYESAVESSKYHPNLICTTSSCKKVISQKQSVVVCSYCAKFYHPPCKGIIGASKIQKAAESNWVCSPACSKANDSELVISSDSENPVSLPDIMLQLKKMETKLNTLDVLEKTLSDLETSQNFISSSLDDFKAKVDELTNENSYLKNKISNLEHNLNTCEEKVNWLESKIDLPEQSRISRNIIITGLPNGYENPPNLIFETILKIGQQISVEDIVSISKIKQSTTNVKSVLNNAFTVTLRTSALQQEILTKFRKKKTLFLDEVDESLGKSRIYVLHHFTKYQSKLYAEAKKLKHKFNFRFLWCSNNNILLRKSPGGAIHHIRTLYDVTRLQQGLNAPDSPEHILQPNHSSLDDGEQT